MAQTNIGTTGRGTAILSRDQLQLTNIVRLPTGRGMAASFQNLTLVNIYVPSGAERREREQFLASEVPYLLQGIPTSLVMGGNFNSVLSNADLTGHTNYSRTLQELIRGYDLVDMWETARGQATYTHYTSRGA